MKTQILKILPQKSRMFLLKKYLTYKNRELNTLLTPTSVIFYVTNRCNAKCGHCFFWKELNIKHLELSLDEIKKIALSLKHPAKFVLTGGEPTLRKELPEICEILYRDNKAIGINIPTNGILTEMIVEKVEKILNVFPNPVKIQVSLDGTEKYHDKLRGVPGNYKRAMATVERLKSLRQKYPHLNVEIASTVTHFNIHDLYDFIQETKDLGIQHKFSLVRGVDLGVYDLPQEAKSGFAPKDEKFLLPPVEKLWKFYSYLIKLNKVHHFLSKRQELKIKYQIQMVEHQKRILDCKAGKIDAVLYADGTVAMCELSKVVGNIRDYDLDFFKIWHSEPANEMRTKITKCFCIHGCNMYTAMQYDPQTQLELLSY